MNSLKINTLPFGANFYTRMPNEKDLVKPFEQKTKQDNYYSLNHSFISRSRFASDVFQLLDPDLEIVEKLEVDYTVDSFTRSKEENVDKLVNIYDVLKSKAKMNEAISDMRSRAFCYEQSAKELRKNAKSLEDNVPVELSRLMEEKGLTSFAAGFSEHGLK